MNANNDEIESLLIDWESGDLTDTGVIRLRELLKTDLDARNYFVRTQMVGAALKLESAAGLGAADLADEIGNINKDRSTAPISATESACDLISPAAKIAGLEHSGPEHSADERVTVRTERFAEMSKRVLTYGSLAIAAGLLACVLGGRLIYIELTRPATGATEITQTGLTGPETEATSSGLALVTRLVDVTWSENQLPLEAGDALKPGRLAIDAGLMQVEFFSGATVVIEGPAELDLKSTMLAHVHRGRLRAQVPPAARGFSLDVADLKVVDLGTEFGLSVTDNDADVQVFDGEVELHSAQHQVQLLTAGHGVARKSAGEYVDSPVSPDEFVGIASIADRDESQHLERYTRWQQWSAEVRRDPRLIAYYTFDQPTPWRRTLASSIERKSESGRSAKESPTDDPLDGAIVGATKSPGRWAAKGALEFKRPGDRVRVNISGEFDSLTFACWAKIDSLDRRFSSLFLTDNYDQGEPHWQILGSGQLYFSVRPNDTGDKRRGDHKVLSAPFWTPSMSGKWMHLAVTYDAKTRRTTHFLNGKVLHTESLPADKAVEVTRIGTASIGNWALPTLPDAEFAIRNLNGCIDEFMLLGAALSPDEIAGIYDHGKP